MQRIVFIIAMLALTLGQAHAQRTLANMQAIQLTRGTVNSFSFNNASHTGVAISTFNKVGDQWVFGAEYLNKRLNYKTQQIPMAQITAEGGYYRNFISDASKSFFMSIGGSALLGYETSNWNDKLLFDGATLLNKDAFIYGVAITLQTEVYLSDVVVLIANVRERMLLGGSFNKLNTQLGLGVKFIIN